MNGTNCNTDERGLLPYPVILAATKGDPEAMSIFRRMGRKSWQGKFTSEYVCQL